MDDTLRTNNTPQDENTELDPTQHVSADLNVGEKDSNPEDLDSRWLRWKCLKCGYLYEGTRELKKCPRCSNEDPDYFADAD